MKLSCVVAALGFAGLLVLAAWETPRLARRPSSSRPRWIAVPIEPPPAPPEDLFGRGERLYRWYCIPCHGAEGHGDGPTGERLAVRPRDLTRGVYKLKTSAPGEMPFDEDLYRTITAGIPPSGMPPFAEFDAEERWSLVAFVKTLARDASGVSPFERFPARTPAAPPRTDAPPATANPVEATVLRRRRSGTPPGSPRGSRTSPWALSSSWADRNPRTFSAR